MRLPHGQDAFDTGQRRLDTHTWLSTQKRLLQGSMQGGRGGQAAMCCRLDAAHAHPLAETQAAREKQSLPDGRLRRVDLQQEGAT